MSKRGSGKQITKDDDVDRLAEGGEEGSFEDQKASAEQMATRKIFVPKRMLSAAAASQAAAPAPAAEAPAFPVFKFGSTETAAETNGKSSFPSFNFGTPSTTTEIKTESAPAAPAAAPASAAQATESTATSSTSSSTAESSAATASSSSSSTDSSSGTSSAFSGFSFGSGGFNFGNATWGKLESFSSIAPSSSSAFSLSSSSSTFQFDNTAPVLKDAPPVVLEEFKNKAPEASGEEDETTICKANVRAFVLEKIEKKADKTEEGDKKEEAASSSSAGETATKWAERGRGDVKINKREDGGKTLFRLLMRAEKTHRVVINAPLLANFKFTPENEKFIRFASVDHELKPVAYLLRFTSKDDYRTFSAGLTDAVAQLQGAEKTA